MVTKALRDLTKYNFAEKSAMIYLILYPNPDNPLTAKLITMDRETKKPLGVVIQSKLPAVLSRIQNCGYPVEKDTINYALSVLDTEENGQAADTTAVILSDVAGAIATSRKLAYNAIDFIYRSEGFLVYDCRSKAQAKKLYKIAMGYAPDFLSDREGNKVAIWKNAKKQ